MNRNQISPIIVDLLARIAELSRTWPENSQYQFNLEIQQAQVVGAKELHLRPSVALPGQLIMPLAWPSHEEW